MGAIPEAVLDEIKRRTDLAALISEHVALKRSGRGFLGLCPFHQEKTPSFHVDPERGFFHCFGCNAGGNAFTFLMRVTGATFPEAARSLAARAGVALPESRTSGVHDRLAEVNGLAAELFSLILLQSRRGERGREYLARRGIDDDTARRFQLGFAPTEGWVEKLLGRNVSPADLRTLGLASPSRSGRGMFPLFRDRLMFPIHDLSGRVIAFGGRAVGDAKGPKYLNSPETPLYRKGHHLYGLGLARETIRAEGRIVLVEGYLDAIALAQAGMRNVAAVLGTALTVDQLKLARRFSEDIVICFDGDEAGRRAALRAFPLCVDEADLWPRAVFLPPGEDPDSLVRGSGVAALAERVASATTLFDFYLDELVGRDAGVGESARAATRMAALLGKVSDPIVRDKIVRGVAGRLGISEAALVEAARRSRQAEAGRGSASARAAGQGGPARTTPDGRDVPPPTGARGASPRAARARVHFSTEAELVELVLCDPDVAARAAREEVWRGFGDEELKELVQRILERRTGDTPFEASELLAELPRGMAERVSRRLATSSPDELRRAGDEWFAHRAERHARADRQAWIARLRAAEHRRDDAEVAAALEALQRYRASEEQRDAGHDDVGDLEEAAVAEGTGDAAQGTAGEEPSHAAPPEAAPPDRTSSYDEEPPYGDAPTGEEPLFDDGAYADDAARDDAAGDDVDFER